MPGTSTGQYSVVLAVREGGEVVVPSMVVTDMMGEMERWTWKMLSLNTLLTPSLTDYTLHHSTTTVTPYKTVSRLTDLNPNISSSLGITLHSTVFYDEAESASLLVSGNVKINCCDGGGGCVSGLTDLEVLINVRIILPGGCQSSGYPLLSPHWTAWLLPLLSSAQLLAKLEQPIRGVRCPQPTNQSYSRSGAALSGTGAT